MFEKIILTVEVQIKKIFGSSFVRNTAKLSSGTTIAQLVSIGTAPILYRIYDKDDYGTLGYFMAIAGVIGALSTLQYLQPIILEKENENAKKVLWLNRMLNLAFSIILTLCILLLHDQIILLLNSPSLSIWIYFIPLSVFFAGQNEIYRVWANRTKKYNILAQNSIYTALAVPVVSIPIGFFISGPLGLFLGYWTSQIVPAFILFIRIGKVEKFSLKGLNYLVLKGYARKYKNFPFYNLPSDFINRLSNQLPVFMLGQFASVSSIGVYNLCARILGLPLTLISNAIAEVFKQRAAEDYFRLGNYHYIFKKTVLGTFALTLIPTVVILFYAPELFSFAFGEEWLESGILAQFLIFYFMVKFIVSPVSYAIVINNKLHIGLLKNIVTLILMFIVFYCGLEYLNYTYIKVIGAFGVTYAIFDLIYLYYLYHISKANLSKTIKTQSL